MKELRLQVLKRAVSHMVQGNTDRATNLLEAYTVAVSKVIVNETNYANAEDPEFAARRELQRELEDDLDADRVDVEGDMEGELPALDAEASDIAELPADEDTTIDAVSDMLTQLLKNSNLSSTSLEQIVDIIQRDQGSMEAGVEGEPVEGQEGIEGNVVADMISALVQQKADELSPEDLDKIVSIVAGEHTEVTSDMEEPSVEVDPTDALQTDVEPSPDATDPVEDLKSVK